MDKEISEINDYLNITCSNNPIEIQERISVIMVYLNRSGEMLADDPHKDCLKFLLSNI